MSVTRVGINGFGRMDRLALRAAWGGPALELAHVDELNADTATSAHLLTFDSVQGRWERDVLGQGDLLTVEGRPISHSSIAEPADVPWREHESTSCSSARGAFGRSSRSRRTSRWASAR